MRHFRSWDGTELAYRVAGSGPPLACIPGGPGQAAEYLGDLGGLSSHRTLILLDNRGTGASQVPRDPVTYRVDRLVRDVEALPGRLATLAAPVLLVAGEYDIWPTYEPVRGLAALLGSADLALLPRAGHFPWVDDPVSFTAIVREFLARHPAPPDA